MQDPGPPSAAGGAAVRPERPWRTWIGLGSLSVGIVVLALVRRPSNDLVGPGRPDAPTSRRAGAGRLREEALAACAAKDWIACEIRLDAAQEVDPAGEAADPV